MVQYDLDIFYQYKSNKIVRMHILFENIPYNQPQINETLMNLLLVINPYEISYDQCWG